MLHFRGGNMISISGDYACIDVNGISLYFGYEETDRNGEWCFTIRNDNIKTSENINNLLIQIPASKIGYTRTCEEALLLGIEKAIARGVLRISYNTEGV